MNGIDAIATFLILILEKLGSGERIQEVTLERRPDPRRGGGVEESA